MVEINTLLWDVGGVVLTDGWDQAIQRKAAEQFELDVEDFQERHKRVEAVFETGRLSLGQYLYQTVFYRPRPFTINKEAGLSAIARPPGRGAGLDVSSPNTNR